MGSRFETVFISELVSCLAASVPDVQAPVSAKKEPGQLARSVLKRARLTSLHWLVEPLVEPSPAFSQSGRSVFDWISPKTLLPAKLLVDWNVQNISGQGFLTCCQ